jgi:predicted kinase
VIAVFSGPPCSGKSLIGAMAAQACGVTHLEMDAIRVRLMPGAAHTRADREVAYRAMHLAAELLVRRGDSVIVNAGYSHACDRRAIEEVALRTRAPLLLVEFTVTPATAVARSRARRATHPGADLTDERVVDLVVHFPYFRGGLVVDGEQRPEANLPRVLDYLSSPLGLRPGLWPQAGL